MRVACDINLNLFYKGQSSVEAQALSLAQVLEAKTSRSTSNEYLTVVVSLLFSAVAGGAVVLYRRAKRQTQKG